VSSAAANLTICRRCPLARCAGQCACTDGQPIEQHADAGECPAGKFAGRSASPLTMIAHGAAGIAKAVTATGGASEEVIRSRTAICGGCPEAVMVAGVFQKCEVCGCGTWAKVRNAAEACPLGKWDSAARQRGDL
jgi:hypothetical protein